MRFSLPTLQRKSKGLFLEQYVRGSVLQILTKDVRCGMPYVNARWLGGMMTNFQTIRTRVQRMEELEAM